MNIRKILLLVLVFLGYSVAIFAVTLDERVANISFSANLVANFGFTQSPDGYNSDVPADTVIEFSDYDSGTNRIRTGVYYVYWQIFSDKVRLSVTATDLSGTNSSGQAASVAWEDVYGRLNYNSPYIFYEPGYPEDQKKNILPFRLQINNPASVDWSVENYTGTITLTLEATD